jgi:hypothetical protein
VYISIWSQALGANLPTPAIEKEFPTFEHQEKIWPDRDDSTTPQAPEAFEAIVATMDEPSHRQGIAGSKFRRGYTSGAAGLQKLDLRRVAGQKKKHPHVIYDEAKLYVANFKIPI